MQVYDNIRAGSYVTNGNIKTDDEPQAYRKYDGDKDGFINFSEFVNFKKDNSTVNELVREHSYINKYEQMMKEYEAVEKEMNEDIEREAPRLV